MPSCGAHGGRPFSSAFGMGSTVFQAGVHHGGQPLSLDLRQIGLGPTLDGFAGDLRALPGAADRLIWESFLGLFFP